MFILPYKVGRCPLLEQSREQWPSHNFEILRFSRKKKQVSKQAANKQANQTRLEEWIDFVRLEAYFHAYTIDAESAASIVSDRPIKRPLAADVVGLVRSRVSAELFVLIISIDAWRGRNALDSMDVLSAPLEPE